MKTKDKQSYKTRQDRVRQAEYEACVKAPPPKTWSARMPAYCYTELCPAGELRMHLPDNVRPERGETVE